MDVQKTVFFLLITLIPMSDSVELRVREAQKGNKDHKIIINELSCWTSRQL